MEGVCFVKVVVTMEVLTVGVDGPSRRRKLSLLASIFPDMIKSHKLFTDCKRISVVFCIIFGQIALPCPERAGRTMSSSTSPSPCACGKYLLLHRMTHSRKSAYHLTPQA